MVPLVVVDAGPVEEAAHVGTRVGRRSAAIRARCRTATRRRPFQPRVHRPGSDGRAARRRGVRARCRDLRSTARNPWVRHARPAGTARSCPLRRHRSRSSTRSRRDRTLPSSRGSPVPRRPGSSSTPSRSARIQTVQYIASSLASMSSVCTLSASAKYGERLWIVATGCPPPRSSRHASRCASNIAPSTSNRRALLRIDARERGGLVDRLPSEHEIAEGLRTERNVPRPEVGTRMLVDEAALADLGEPARQREVMQADPRLHARRVRGREHLAVVLDRRGVAPAFLGLDARPLDRQPVVRQAVLRVELEVLGIARAEPVAVTRRRHPPRPLHRVPVGRGRGAFGLRRRRTGTPPEAFGESHHTLVGSLGGGIPAAVPSGTFALPASSLVRCALSAHRVFERSRFRRTVGHERAWNEPGTRLVASVARAARRRRRQAGSMSERETSRVPRLVASVARAARRRRRQERET